ncbi:ATP-binding protein [Lunatimonas salinarum]|uniref:ATP-binding protein n=1 Tax=Lunatimonas salinarum TaxID=1774590 RepID=UPI001ADFBCC8|nr:ATP-binding protein [Lunatimonas salinarum]
MKLKTKLYLSFGFLFFLIVLLSGLGSLFVRQLADDSKAIIQDNYRTLDYMQQIKTSLDRLILVIGQEDLKSLKERDTALDLLEVSIENQLKNITEPGENKLSEELAQQFEILKVALIEESPTALGINNQFLLYQIVALQDLSSKIYELNIQTLLRKNDTANQTAERVILYMAITGVTGSILSLIFIIGFPEVIFDPLQKLNEGIKAIAAKKYDQVLDEKQGDELGEIAASFNQMAVKLKEYEASSYALLYSEKKRIDAIVSQMHEGIIGIDENQRILFVNDFAKSIFNLHGDQINGEHIQSLAKKNDFIASFASDFALGGEESLQPKSIKVVVSGLEKTFSREIIPINIQQKEVRVNIGYVVVLTDITQYSERDKAKTQFIATISHELKTPISSIGLGLKLLEDQRTGTLNEEQQKLVKSLQEDKNRLLSITGELLDITQAETGNITLEQEIFKPEEVILSATEALQLPLEEKNIQLKLEIVNNDPVLGDPNKVVWVIVNLLSNAIRYSRQGGSIEVTCSDKNSNRIWFEVQDHGKGIPEAYQSQLFEKYYKVPGSKSSGSGLGLAISKEFIKAMGGSIGAKSEVGKGSRFWFTLNKA